MSHISLQHTATHYTTLHHTATHSNTQQHSATPHLLQPHIIRALPQLIGLFSRDKVMHKSNAGIATHFSKILESQRYSHFM